MTDWIADNWVNIAVAAVICIIVFFAVRSIVKDRRSGKGSCGCGCSGCSGCGKPTKNRSKRKAT